MRHFGRAGSVRNIEGMQGQERRSETAPPAGQPAPCHVDNGPVRPLDYRSLSKVNVPPLARSEVLMYACEPAEQFVRFMMLALKKSPPMT